MLRRLGLPAVVLVAAVASGCSSSGSERAQSTEKTDSSPATSAAANTTAPTTSTRSTAPPATSTRPDPTRPAVKAYLTYRATVTAAQESPSSSARLKALAATTIDPQQGKDGNTLLQDHLDSIAWRGAPPRPRVTVTQNRLQAKPYPTVIVRDCPTVSASWRPYLTTDNKPVAVEYPRGSARPPFAISVTVVRYKSRWVVQNVITSMRKTCAP